MDGTSDNAVTPMEASSVDGPELDTTHLFAEFDKACAALTPSLRR
ncbi:hypothetical protein [Nocardia sp. NBC_01009]|nr:hypothetical protein OHA42_20755 [Nocardia sp. NBC_01009]